MREAYANLSQEDLSIGCGCSVVEGPSSDVCSPDSQTFYIETPAVVGIPWVGITQEDSGKFLSNDGENPIWVTVAYSEENFTTEYKESLDNFINGDYQWKVQEW